MLLFFDVSILQHESMRFLTLLHSLDDTREMTETVSETVSETVTKLTQSQSSLTSTKLTQTSYTIYDPVLYEKYRIMSYLFSSDNLLKRNYKQLVPISHPFEKITSTITSEFIRNGQPLKITNAFMKIYELMLFLDERDYLGLSRNSDGDFTMYDIAGAPGMFVLAIEHFLKKYNRNLDWDASSLIGGTALVDVYGLYKDNPNRFMPCNLLNEEDVNAEIEKAKMKKRSYQLVTGDVGIYHEDDYEHLQEERQLDLEWSQMFLGVSLVAVRGNMILKMYSFTTLESLYLLDTLTKYFRYVYITKPYTTRIFNDESYIVCIDRNDHDVASGTNPLPFRRPHVPSSYTSPNLPLVKSFEYSRLDIKYRMVSLIERMYRSNPNYTIEEYRNNRIYNEFCSEFDSLYRLFESIH